VRVLALLLLAVALPARAEELILLMSTQDVAITSNYTGAKVTVFGAIERDATSISRSGRYEVVVTVSGVASALQVRSKERFGPFWVNRTLHRYANVPDYYAVLSTGPVATIANEPARERYKLGLGHLLPPLADLPDEINPDKSAREALQRLRRAAGLSIEDPRGVQMPRPNLFAAAIPLPASAPPGRYVVTATVLAEGVPLKSTNTSFVVRKTGFEAYVAAYARDNAWLYGLATAGLAALFGFLGNLIFRRD